MYRIKEGVGGEETAAVTVMETDRAVTQGGQGDLNTSKSF